MRCCLLTVAWLLTFSVPSLAADAPTETPWPRHIIDDTSRGADGVRLADVNGDGLPDVATGWEEGGVVRICLHPGKQKVRDRWPSVMVGKAGSPEDAVFADLDGDGAFDVVSCCEGNTRCVFVHWAPKDKARLLDASAWKTEPIPDTAKVTQWMYALPLQIDGRSGIDLVVASKNEGGLIGWLASPDDPRDAAGWKLHRLRDCGWVMSLEAHDMDGDGDLDVLASDRRGPRRGAFWLENPGPKAAGSGKPWNEHAVGGSNVEAMFLCRGDLDGDGRADVALASKTHVLLFRATGNAAAPWEEHRFAVPETCGGGKGVAIADIDGDGRRDVVLTCEGAKPPKSGVRWFSYRTSPWSADWTSHELSGPAGVKFDRPEVLDLDGDGDLDVMTTCEAQENLGVVWYENPAR